MDVKVQNVLAKTDDMTDEEYQEAMRVASFLYAVMDIRDFCKKYQPNHCDGCPANKGGCAFMQGHSPVEWDV